MQWPKSKRYLFLTNLIDQNLGCWSWLFFKKFQNSWLNIESLLQYLPTVTLSSSQVKCITLTCYIRNILVWTTSMNIYYFGTFTWLARNPIRLFRLFRYFSEFLWDIISLINRRYERMYALSLIFHITCNIHCIYDKSKVLTSSSLGLFVSICTQNQWKQ